MAPSSVQKTSMISVLFVCLGNICRSPAAESIFTHLIKQKGLQDHFTIDSAGTSGYHQGHPADERMRAHAQKRGYQLQGLSRPFHHQDFEQFDIILAMDDSNHHNMACLTSQQKYLDKIHTMMSYAPDLPEKEVPDPYYGGDKGFERVIDILEEACRNLLTSLEKQFPDRLP